MIQTNRELERMRRKLLAAFSSDGRGSQAAVCVDSILWKLRFIDFHSNFLTRMQWGELHALGLPGHTDPVRIDCGEQENIIVQLGSSQIGRMAVLLCFDGFVAACVNAVDTLAQTVNALYGLGIGERSANAPVVRRKVAPQSPLGLVLHNIPGIDWMAPLRRIRGECQHYNIAGVIEDPTRAFGATPGALQVKAEFALDGIEDKSVTVYAEVAREKTLELLRAAAVAIADNPSNPCIP